MFLRCLVQLADDQWLDAMSREPSVALGKLRFGLKQNVNTQNGRHQHDRRQMNIPTVCSMLSLADAPGPDPGAPERSPLGRDGDFRLEPAGVDQLTCLDGAGQILPIPGQPQVQPANPFKGRAQEDISALLFGSSPQDEMVRVPAHDGEPAMRDVSALQFVAYERGQLLGAGYGESLVAKRSPQAHA